MGPSPALGVPLPANKEAVHRGTPTVPSAAEPAGQAPPHAHGTAGAAPPAHQEPGGQGTPKGATEPAGQCAPGGAAHEPEHAAVDWPAAPHLPAGHRPQRLCRCSRTRRGTGRKIAPARRWCWTLQK